ncbi:MULTISPECIES: FadR/GntR family transcriptional regulator [unclassified Xanthobacter]|uniref:FadR/GntR family transcriptional regulator n=1 Tax=unclassified Xanthobacter TaxID=2623496 RepID=UPI001EDEC548|nr:MULTISPECIES: FCD domain-containing protein [unclassified Xanthobacter]
MSLLFDPVQAEPAFRLVARTIEEKILAGEIAPGDPLPAEARLAEQLGVNRSTVREAIRVLEQNGFVRRELGRKKLYASIPESDVISRRLTAAMVLHQVTFEELWEAMFALEPAAAASAAHRSDEDDLAAIARNLEATRQALQDSSSLTKLDIEFHELVAKATRNRAIQVARLPLSELFYPPFYRVMSRLNAGQRLLVAHESIYEAIRDHDEKRARDWMEKHILDFKRGYELANLDMSSPVDMPEK